MRVSRRLVITPGMGIGPEVTLRALAHDGWSDVVLVGRSEALAVANQQAALPLVAVRDLDQRVEGIPVLDPGDEQEPAEVAAIRIAATACMQGRAAALVTGPIHKARLVERGFAFRGHTDFLGHLCQAPREVMAFVGGELRVALVTTHIPLMQVGAALHAEDIERVVRTSEAALRSDLGIEAPRVAVCGLNPHAGEDGLLGTEEQEIIGPACERLRNAGLSIDGPVSAETAFLAARTGRVDLIVAMYHDQGLAPLKAVDFGRSVNWTLGLPIVRTSVDHGTADALVGTGTADPASMQAAVRLARTIVARRAGR